MLENFPVQDNPPHEAIELKIRGSLLAATEAKQIIVEKITTFVQNLQNDGTAFEIPGQALGKPFETREKGNFIHYHVEEVQSLLSQIEQELAVFEGQPFFYLKWSIRVPIIEAPDQSVGYDFKKLKLIEAVINQCFGNICEGTFQPAVAVAGLQSVAGAVYIYPDKINEIVQANLKPSVIPTNTQENKTVTDSSVRKIEELGKFPWYILALFLFVVGLGGIIGLTVTGFFLSLWTIIPAAVLLIGVGIAIEILYEEYQQRQSVFQVPQSKQINLDKDIINLEEDIKELEEGMKKFKEESKQKLDELERESKKKFDEFKKDFEQKTEIIYQEGIDYIRKGQFKASIALFEEASRRGHALAFVWYARINLDMGEMQKDGWQKIYPGEPQDIIKWLEQEANKGNTDAQISLGWCYWKGFCVDQNRNKAQEYYEKAASECDVLAYYDLGLMHDSNDYFEEAVGYFRKASERGYAPAQYQLAYHYETGRGVEKEVAAEEFKNVFERTACLAKNWNNPQMFFQAYPRDEDKDVGARWRDKQAVIWYEKAAEQGFAPAMTRLGLCYQFSPYNRKNQGKAVELYRKAADQGYAQAQFCLGYSYHYGCIDGTILRFDLKEAISYYELASAQGYANAQYELGNCYYNGQGVQQDFKKAVEYCELAADKDHTDAQCLLGECYFLGKGVEKNSEKAKHYFELAADKGHSKAQYNLGLCYMQFGIDKESNFSKAIHFFKAGAENGHQPAKNAVTTFCTKVLL